MAGATPSTYPIAASSCCSSLLLMRLSRGRLFVGRLISLTGLLEHHFHSRRACSKTEDSSVISRRTDGAATSFNRRSRHAPTWSPVMRPSWSPTNSKSEISLSRRISSHRCPALVGETSDLYFSMACFKVKDDEGPLLPAAMISASRCVAHAAACAFVGNV
ncbi:hypothetical protein D9M68_782820 [compost metagenome]